MLVRIIMSSLTTVLDAGAVRAVLLDVGMREVPDPDAALILWTDVDAPAQTGNAVRKQRASVLTGVVSACELVAINRYTQGYAVLAFGLIPITGRVVVTPGCQIGYMHGLPGVVDWCFYCKIT